MAMSLMFHKEERSKSLLCIGSKNKLNFKFKFEIFTDEKDSYF